MRPLKVVLRGVDELYESEHPRSGKESTCCDLDRLLGLTQGSAGGVELALQGSTAVGLDACLLARTLKLTARLVKLHTRW